MPCSYVIGTVSAIIIWGRPCRSWIFGRAEIAVISWLTYQTSIWSFKFQRPQIVASCLDNQVNIFFIIIIFFIAVCGVGVNMHMCMSQHIQRPENSFQKSALSFHPVEVVSLVLFLLHCVLQVSWSACLWVVLWCLGRGSGTLDACHDILLFFILSVSSEDWTQVIRIGCSGFYLLRHLSLTLTLTQHFEKVCIVPKNNFEYICTQHT